MKYILLASITTSWTVLAFLYRLGSKKNRPANVLAASAALTWLALTLALAWAGHAEVFAAPRGIYLAGTLGGLGLAAAMPLLLAAVARGNLAVSWTMLTLSFAAVSLLGIMYPGEKVQVSGVAGLATAALAIVLLGWDGAVSGAAGGFKRGWALFMTLAFLSNTLLLYVYTLGKAWGGVEPFDHKMAFLLMQTAVFFAASGPLAIRERRREGKLAAAAVGAAVGAVQFAGNYAVMAALGDFHVPSYVFFPATTGGSTITVALLSAFILGERPGIRGLIGLALGLAAMCLLGSAA